MNMKQVKRIAVAALCMAAVLLCLGGCGSFYQSTAVQESVPAEAAAPEENRESVIEAQPDAEAQPAAEPTPEPSPEPSPEPTPDHAGASTINFQLVMFSAIGLLALAALIGVVIFLRKDSKNKSGN